MGMGEWEVGVRVEVGRNVHEMQEEKCVSHLRERGTKQIEESEIGVERARERERVVKRERERIAAKELNDERKSEGTLRTKQRLATCKALVRSFPPLSGFLYTKKPPLLQRTETNNRVLRGLA
jgi:hypothetical protein